MSPRHTTGDVHRPEWLQINDRSATDILQDNCNTITAQETERVKNGERSPAEAACRIRMICQNLITQNDINNAFWRGFNQGLEDGGIMALDRLAWGQWEIVHILAEQIRLENAGSWEYAVGDYFSTVGSVGLDIALIGSGLAWASGGEIAITSSRLTRLGAKNSTFLRINPLGAPFWRSSSRWFHHLPHWHFRNPLRWPPGAGRGIGRHLPWEWFL